MYRHVQVSRAFEEARGDGEEGGVTRRGWG